MWVHITIIRVPITDQTWKIWTHRECSAYIGVEMWNNVKWLLTGTLIIKKLLKYKSTEINPSHPSPCSLSGPRQSHHKQFLLRVSEVIYRLDVKEVFSLCLTWSVTFTMCLCFSGHGNTGQSVGRKHKLQTSKRSVRILCVSAVLDVVWSLHICITLGCDRDHFYIRK